MSLLPSSLKKPLLHQNIGCQELLSRGNFRHSGMLMKQLTRHRGRHKTVFGSFLDKLPWVERYVVLCDGCLYHYTSSQAKKPSGSYSLFGYHQVIRAGDVPIKKQPWAFKIVHIEREVHSKYFSAPSEREMKVWMKEIKAELIVANAEVISKQNISVSEDDDVEKSVYGDNEELVKAESVKSKRTSEVDDADDDVDDDEYLEIDDELQKSVPERVGGKSDSSKTQYPQPPLPPPWKKPDASQTSPFINYQGQRNSGSSTDESSETASTKRKQTYFAGTPVPQPPPYNTNVGQKSSQDNKNESGMMEEAYWSGSDKKEGDKIIQDISKEGVYLIRDSEQCAKTLVCFADGRLARYKIRQSPDSMYNIQDGKNFPSISLLLKYYHDNKLPNKSTALTQPYTKHY